MQNLDEFAELIKKSTILTTPEKQEWLSMLPVMNDKQLAELKSILAVSGSENVTPAAPQRVSVVQPAPKEGQSVITHAGNVVEASAPLSHIKNLPQQVRQVSPSAAPPIAPEEPKKVLPLKSDALPLEVRRPMVEVPRRSTQNIITPNSGIARDNTPYAPVAGKAPHMPETLTDVAELTVASIRELNTLELISRLQDMVRNFGYFELLFSLEQSPLYKLYLYMGNKILEEGIAYKQLEVFMQTEGREYITKIEFERFTDILRKIQINE